ncbi:MAG: hypothetical protein IPP87_05605 [Ideonella sp.]|nr:hypothetical protein [Ideonella sp.]
MSARARILIGDSLGGYSAMASAADVPADQFRGLIDTLATRAATQP